MESIRIQKPGWDLKRLVDVHVDRLEALMNLSYLMRTDIDRQENLKVYLRYMDMVIEGMKSDESLLDS